MAGFALLMGFFFLSAMLVTGRGAVVLGIAATGFELTGTDGMMLTELVVVAATAGISVLTGTGHGRGIDADVVEAVATDVWCIAEMSLGGLGFFFLTTGGASIRCSGSLSLDTVASESLDDESIDSYCRI